MLSGIAFISVLIHKNSPSTVINVTPTKLSIHQDAVWGICPLYIQHTKKCTQWRVTAKSKHCFVLHTMNHSPKALQIKKKKVSFTVLFELILDVPVNNFSVMLGQVFLEWTSTKQGLMCLAQGHNAVTPVRLEPTALRSWVKRPTTEPLCSQYSFTVTIKTLFNSLKAG